MTDRLGRSTYRRALADGTARILTPAGTPPPSIGRRLPPSEWQLPHATPLTFEDRLLRYTGSAEPDAWARVTPRQRRRIQHKENRSLAPFADRGDGLIERRP